jgi:hypothetical protein
MAKEQWNEGTFENILETTKSRPEKSVKGKADGDRETSSQPCLHRSKTNAVVRRKERVLLMKQPLWGLEACDVMSINRRRNITGRLVEQTKESNGEVEDTKWRMDGYTKRNAALHATTSITRPSGHATRATYTISTYFSQPEKQNKGGI